MDFKITIENIDFKDNSLNFDIKGEREFGLDKSVVNSLRRVLLSGISTVAFRTEVKDSDIVVVRNDTSLHNEFLIHRIGLIPLYFNPDEFSKQFLFYLKVDGDPENPIKTVYANDFDIYPLNKHIDSKDLKEIKLEYYDLSKPLDEKEKEKIFRPFEFKNEKNYCMITELKSKDSSLELYGSPSVSYGYEDSRFSAVSCSAYSFKKDDALFQTILKEKIMVQDIEKEKQEEFKKELFISEAERYFYRDMEAEPFWYEFKIDSVHFMNSKELFIRANKIMIDHFELLKKEIPKISKGEESILELKTNKDNVYQLVIQGVDDTVGNVYQSFISRYMIDDESVFSLCGYKRTHPLEETIIVYLSLNPRNKVFKSNETQKTFVIINTLREACDGLINIYSLIKDQAEKEL
jgi:DNA-directed RNA polymerase alpha subunit/DNA-directed RNA polymerase subunit L